MEKLRVVSFRLQRVAVAVICLAASCLTTVNLQASSAVLKSIVISPRQSSIVTGGTQQFTAVGTYSDGHKKNITSTATWTSSAPGVVSVGNTGLANGVSAGQAKVTAALLSIRGSANVTVTPALVSITVTPAGTTIVVGKNQQFTATGTYTDGTTKDVTSSVAWSSSSTNIVTINSAGFGTAVIGGVLPGGPPGQSTISATLSSVNGATTLTVTNNLTAIAISPSSATLSQVGAQQAFTATGTYQDQSTADITSSATWSAGTSCVLTITPTGNGAGTATALGLGTAPVTAAENGIVGTASATVGTPPPASGLIPASFFGMTIGDDSLVPYPYPPTSTVPIGAIGHPTELAWSTIEPSPGSFDFTFYDAYADLAAQHGVPFIVTFGWTPYWAASPSWQQSKYCYQDLNWCSAPPQNNSDWTAFITAVVNHYNGINAPKVQYYEIWNEANDEASWAGSQQGLVQLANLAYKIIHPTGALLGAPSVTDVVSGSSGAATWLTTYLEPVSNGGWGGAQYADFGSFHGYLAPTGFSPYPFPEECSLSGYGDITTRALSIRSVLDANGLAGKPMFDSEGSWGEANITDSDQQVAWLARWYLLQAGSQVVQSAYWFAWGQSTPGKPGDQNQWGLISDDSGVTPTAAGIAYGQIYDWLVGATVSPCSSSEDASNLGNYVWTCSVVSSTGQQELAIWYYSPDETGILSYLPASQYGHYLDLTGVTHTVNPPITITAKPILLTP